MDLKELALNEGSRHPWELVRVEVVRHFIHRTFPQGGKLNILDVGSGDTFMIRQLAGYFKEASFFAVDTGYSKEFIEQQNHGFENDHLKIKVYSELNMAEQEYGDKIDLILLLDVIEHVPDDIQFLKGLTQLPSVSSDTRFLITVPAYQSLFCSHDVFLGHYRRYNNGLLKKNVREAGLETVQMGYFFLVPLLFRVMEVLLEKTGLKKGNATGIGRWQGGRLSTNFLSMILRMDFWKTRTLRRLAIKMPGLSNFAICKKSV